MFEWSNAEININSRDIELYLRKEYIAFEFSITPFKAFSEKNSTLYLCCMILQPTKTSFKILLVRVCDIKDEVENIQDTYQTINEVSNALINYVQASYR